MSDLPTNNHTRMYDGKCNECLGGYVSLKILQDFDEYLTISDIK